MLIAALSGIIDFIWSNEIANQVMSYAEGLEPELSETETLFFMGSFILIALCLIASVIGLMLFKNWGRILYLFLFVLGLFLPLYSPINYIVTSPLSQFFYDLSCFGEGAILALCYFSPVTKYFETKIQ